MCVFLKADAHCAPYMEPVDRLGIVCVKVADTCKVLIGGYRISEYECSVKFLLFQILISLIVLKLTYGKLFECKLRLVSH